VPIQPSAESVVVCPPRISIVNVFENPEKLPLAANPKSNNETSSLNILKLHASSVAHTPVAIILTRKVAVE
jgi:hypothetical protein